MYILYLCERQNLTVFGGSKIALFRFFRPTLLSSCMVNMDILQDGRGYIIGYMYNFFGNFLTRK
jgi:hypothetical protein